MATPTTDVPLTLAEVTRRASKARHSPRTYARSIVKTWPNLTPEARAEVRDILAPVLARVAAGGGSDAAA